MTGANVEVVRDGIEAMNRGDWPTTERGLHPDIEWVIAREHPASRTIRGLEELRAYMADWMETLEGLRLEVDEIFERGDRVIAIGRVRGVGAGSGADVVVPIAFVNHFSEGVIVKVEEFLDPQEALDAP
ncbi:MAG TPA: nuclear transport factor 2 family protein [Solirubrobacterales bacterium]|nr:nuclear transport factor 2 family protein [Solirubrobacterales bacterium]